MKTIKILLILICNGLSIHGFADCTSAIVASDGSTYAGGAGTQSSFCFPSGGGTWIMMNGNCFSDLFFELTVTSGMCGLTIYEKYQWESCAELTPIACCPAVTGTCSANLSTFFSYNPALQYYFQFGSSDLSGGGLLFLDGLGSVAGCTDVVAANYNPVATCDDGSCLYGDGGCTISIACNYDSDADFNDGSCIFPDGCTDPLATNYDSAADCDDGSCCYASIVVLHLYDSYGDGWNGGTYTIADEFGAVISTGTLAAGISGSAAICIPEGCFVISVTGGTYPSEITWLLVGTTGGPVSGGAPAVENFSVGTLVNGCTDPVADNYDPDANCDDGSCVYDVEGCTDTAACNYDPDALIDDGSCTYPGCTDVSACNYDATAGCDDGSCTFPGCMDMAACNYVATAGCDDGSCTYSGCTDVSACNYDATAGCDDGSCTFPGCMDMAACNYVATAGCDDGSCTYPGCTDVSACNYDASAACEAGTCFYAQMYFHDADGDGFGDASDAGESLCSPPVYSWSADHTDCDDTDVTVYPGATEVATDLVDNDCDGFALVPISSLTSIYCPADLSLDGAITVTDLLLFMGYFGSTCPL